jgi:SAM-dependent methyltransferase
LIRKILRLWRAGTLGLAIKGEAGDWISALGSRLGAEWLVYNPWTFAAFHRAALETAPTMVAGILDLYPGTRRAVDFGCGTGVYVRELRAKGVETTGFEYAERARRFGQEMGLDLLPFDLREFRTPERGYDLAISFEVAEHISPDLGDRLVEVCCASAPRVVFSAAHPGQPGQGHIHLQPKSYWIERFGRRGFRFDAARTSSLEAYLRTHLIRGFWLADNVGVYEGL